MEVAMKKKMIKEMLHFLKLSYLDENWEKVIEQAEKKEISYSGFLSEIIKKGNRDFVVVNINKIIQGDTIKENIGKRFDHDSDDEVTKTTGIS